MGLVPAGAPRSTPGGPSLGAVWSMQKVLVFAQKVLIFCFNRASVYIKHQTCSIVYCKGPSSGSYDLQFCCRYKVKDVTGGKIQGTFNRHAVSLAFCTEHSSRYFCPFSLAFHDSCVGLQFFLTALIKPFRWRLLQHVVCRGLLGGREITTPFAYLCRSFLSSRPVLKGLGTLIEVCCFVVLMPHNSLRTSICSQLLGSAQPLPLSCCCLDTLQS